ncbi:hypothetical protein IL306_014514 [Fusarium sp. DS 682]|nr:hypothetical protein IL306_014514 [Fusarium sp. DS 682]
MLRQLWFDPAWDTQRPPGQDTVQQCYDEDEFEESEDESDYESTDDEEDEKEGTRGFNLPFEKDDDVSVEESASSQSSGVGPEDPLGDIVLRFCYDMATEDFEDGRASSSLLVYFSAVRGLSRPRGDEYLRPDQFTPVLSRLIYSREALGQATKQSRRLMYEWEPLDPNFNSIRDRLSMATANLWDEFEEAAEAVVAGQAREKGLTDEKMERLCLGMLIGMLDHQFKQSHYDSIVLCALAIMGINEDGGWIEPTDYTPKYSGVIKVARMLVLYQSWHEREEDVAEKMRI